MQMFLTRIGHSIAIKASILKSRRLIKVVAKPQVKGSEIFAFLKRFTADENVPIIVEKEVGEALGFQLLLEWNN